MRPRPRSATGLVVAALLLAACAGPTVPPSPTSPSSAAVGSSGTAPAVAPGERVAMDGFAGGPGFTVPGDLGGKPLVLNVWASWCKPCRTEMPVFQAVSLQLRDRVGFLSVDYLDQQDAARRLVTESRWQPCGLRPAKPRPASTGRGRPRGGWTASPSPSRAARS